MRTTVILALAAAALGAAPQEPSAPNAAGLEFFEKRIRPVLVEKCFKCHSHEAGKPKGGLFLDSREGILRGGLQGPALVAGRPDQSLLIKAIRCAEDDDLEMPPKESERLTEGQVADFIAWVKMGAPDPRAVEPVAKAVPVPAAPSLWSLERLKPVALPSVKDQEWPRTPIDFFVLAKLEEKKLRPAPAADRRTFLRRVTIDLTGLPPTPEEMDAFLADGSPEAYDKIIDRLLNSTGYGERWGRFWLDVARYADTAGSGDDRYPFAYTYRDWVVRSFNEDLPFEQFILRQLAADRLGSGADNRDLSALGFLTVGRRFATVHDVIDDQIDVVTRGFLGLSVSCARCHDHKYDPIPTADYYSLYSIFASSSRPKELPLLTPLPTSPAARDYEKELRERSDAVDAFIRKAQVAVVARLRTPEKVAAFLMALKELQDLPAPRAASEAFRRELHPMLLDRWKKLLARPGGERDPLLGLWRACAALGAQELQEQASALGEKFFGDAGGERLEKVFGGIVPGSLAEVAAGYGRFLSSLALGGPSPDPELEKLREALVAPTGPLTVDAKEIERHVSKTDRDALAELRKKVETLVVTHPGAPPRAMSLEDVPKPRPGQRIFKRGNPAVLGEEVPRRFLACLSEEKRPVFATGSGRLDLARAIADPANPLATRLWVSRVWAGHFGKGLIRTAGELGTRGEPPTHPELLDWLALWFRAEGGSTKKLHRLIVRSSVYRQSVLGEVQTRKADPENRLLGRMEARRLDFEAFRDSLLAVSGDLDLSPGGKPVDLQASPYPRRRTIYGLVDRQNLPGLFRAFDFPDPDLSASQRDETTVPQQALFLLNSPFAADCARRLSRRPDVLADPDASRRVDRVYRIVYGRPPGTEEQTWAAEFLGSGSWEGYVHALLLTNEFAFVP